MITPFTLRDLRLLRQAQKAGVSLCPVEALTRPQSPLWTALMSLLPFDEGQSFTFVLDEQRGDDRRLQGFIQAKRPPARAEMYLRCLTPRLDADEDAFAVWNRLVNHAAAVAGERGIQRLFACAAEGGEEMDALTGTGFSVYTREDIFRLKPDAHLQATAQKGIRPEQGTDAWEINRLYRSVAPHLVQRAEISASTGDAGLDWLCGPLAWSQGEGFVLEDHHGFAGYGYLASGRIGHWLNILLHPRAYDQADRLLDYGLALLNYYPPYPVYCAVREYQGGIRALLEQRRFELLSTQCCMVKHTTARIKEPVRGLVPASPKRVEAPTTTISPTKGS